VVSWEFSACCFFVVFDFKVFSYSRRNFFEGFYDFSSYSAFAVDASERDNVVVEVFVDAFLEEHCCAFKLAEQFSRGAFYGFDHGFVVFRV